MSLTPGSRFGTYDIVSLLGTGGMGEVYRAVDGRLKRQVAIKVLPQSLAADVDRLARFRREAELLATLNHPHIAAIYGIEEHAGATGLVMELVDGPTLADLIAASPIPIADALPIAKQIAAALEAAPEQGIIHRDVKPANIKEGGRHGQGARLRSRQKYRDRVDERVHRITRHHQSGHDHGGRRARHRRGPLHGYGIA